MNPDASWWDEFVGANAIAMGWYNVFRGQPVPSYTPGQATQGGAVQVGPGGVGAQLTMGALIAIVVVVLAIVLLLRK